MNVDNSTIEIASGNARLKDAGITAAKLGANIVGAAATAHDNTRTKILLTFAKNADVDDYIQLHGVSFNYNTMGIPMPRDGRITAVYVADSAGNIGSNTPAYGSGISFAAGARVGIQATVGSGSLRGATVFVFGGGNFSSTQVNATWPMFYTVEIEFD